MGVAVSNWELARAVSTCGPLGGVSGTGLDAVFLRRLQRGEAGGHMRRAARAFPVPGVAERVLERYFVEGGIAEGKAFKSRAVDSLWPASAQLELLVLANFVEVFLAKEGHGGVVGINLLEKIQLPTVPSLFGAMLAGVDYVLMGAGIPRAIPAVLDHLAAGRVADLPVAVVGAGTTVQTSFDPVEFCGGVAPAVKRPKFLPIISSAVLAIALARKATGRVDGFVVEGATAGGHNAPPRGAAVWNGRGEPVYSEKDVVDLEKIKGLGLPFWLAGGFASAGKLREALAVGAAGIQVGTAFAFCRESGIAPELKAKVIAQARGGTTDVFTDAQASPTGFPFKVLQVEATLSEERVYAERRRVCDLGYLREAYARPDGHVGYRCAAEEVEAYVRKGGDADAAKGRRCLCNGLLATAGLGQRLKEGVEEPAILTAGDDVGDIVQYLRDGAEEYSAAAVVASLLGKSGGNGEA
jgi:nitronate monooxygenase